MITCLSKTYYINFHSLQQNGWSGSFVYTFCLFEYCSRDQSECTIINHSKTQFLAESSLNMWTLHYYDQYDNFHNILGFYKKNCTVKQPTKVPRCQIFWLENNWGISIF